MDTNNLEPTIPPAKQSTGNPETYAKTIPVPYAYESRYGEIPPPPPKLVKRKTYIITILLLLLCFAATSVVYVKYLQVQLAVTRTVTHTQVKTEKMVITPTSVSTTIAPLDSSDFPAFVTAFDNAFQIGQWKTVAAHTDKTNFTEGSPDNGMFFNWQDIYPFLQHGSYTTQLVLPPQYLNNGLSMACAVFGSHGVYGHTLTAHQVLYVLGSGDVPAGITGASVNTQAVMEFEEPNIYGPWLWVGWFSDVPIDGSSPNSGYC